MLGGSSRKVSALTSCWKQNETSATRGDVLLIVSFSMFSGYLPSLYLQHQSNANSVHRKVTSHCTRHKNNAFVLEVLDKLRFALHTTYQPVFKSDVGLTEAQYSSV